MLFNLYGTGAEELQRITGIFSAASDYSVIAAEVEDAARTVASLVGPEVIAKAEGLYRLGHEDGLVAAVRQPVAVLAVARYTRNNLVSHDDSGSKVRVDDNEKIPFEWMIDRDERAQRERYFRAMDALYGFLEETQEEAWLSSGTRTAFRSSIVRSLPEFERVYPVDGSYYVFYMLQSLVIESQAKVRKMVGADRWKALTGEAEPTDLSVQLLPLCQRYAVVSAVIKAVRRWSLEVFPLTIARRFSPSYQGNRASRAALRTEMDAYIAGLEAQLAETRDEIAEVLADGANPYAGFDPMPHNDRHNKFFTA